MCCDSPALQVESVFDPGCRASSWIYGGRNDSDGLTSLWQFEDFVNFLAYMYHRVVHYPLTISMMRGCFYGETALLADRLNRLCPRYVALHVQLSSADPFDANLFYWLYFADYMWTFRKINVTAL